MKTRRLKRIKLAGRSHYHVISRIAERRFYLGNDEKDMFCGMMSRVALFSGVKILTYCIMDNHFHLLIEVPKRKPLTLQEVKNKLPLIYRGDDLIRVLKEFQNWEDKKNERMVEDLKLQYERRMFDLSEFMKTLKQRFSIWYNRNHNDRKGTLWEGDRFISVLVQSPRRKSGDMGNRAILTMAAYIELNAVRAGLVNDPKDYSWCGYGAASAGHTSAQHGIGLLMGFLENNRKPWGSASRAYKKHLFFQSTMRNGLSHKTINKKPGENNLLLHEELPHCRIRSFSSGLVIGSKDYVAHIVSQNHACFHPAQQAYPMHKENGQTLYTGKKCA